MVCTYADTVIWYMVNKDQKVHTAVQKGSSKQLNLTTE